MHRCFDFTDRWGGFSALLAQEDAAAPQPLFSPLMMFVGATFFLFYFLVIAPEKRRKREEETLRNELKKNDRIVTAGGIHGTVSSVSDAEDVVTIKVDNQTRLKINRSSISHVVRDPSDADAESTS